MENLKVEYWKNGRFAIVDDSGKVVDDAQGYGYKDKQKANKAMWWKFKGGKQKKDEERKILNVWLKDPINKKIYNEINDTIEYCIKEISCGETTINDIISEIESRENIKIPKYVISNL